jgi:HK97 family phage portal protein
VAVPVTANGQRAMPRQVREPVPILGEATRRLAGGGWGAGGYGWDWFIDPDTGAPMRPPAMLATETTVVGIPAAWKCLTFLANAVASCAPPIEYDADGDKAVDRSNVVERPWSFIGAHEFWTQAVAAAVLFGNFVAIKVDVDADNGYARQVMPVHPRDVQMILVDGLPVYGWMGEAFGWDEVVHVRGYLPPGALWGLGVIEAFRVPLTAALELADYGASTYRTAAENAVVIHVDRPELSETQADGIQARWIARHGSGIRRPAVLPRSMTVTPLSFSPEDAQYLESRQFTVAEIAFMFGLDPTDLTAAIGSGTGTLTYANREQREIERLTHAVGPWLRRFEQAWNDLLPGRRTIRFNVENLLRTDTLTRLQATDIALRTGVFTLNDARGIEHLALYDEWANVPFGRPPAPEPESEPADDEPDVLAQVD